MSAGRNKMLRVNLIGAGDVSFHYQELLKISEKEFDNHIEELAKVLAKHVEISLLPDRGAPFELARKYKEFSGRKVVGIIPLDDRDFGVKHLQPFLEAEHNSKKVFDEVINTENWYKQHMLMALFGDVILMLGNSLGSMYELTSGYYIYKLFLKLKEKVNINKSNLHKDIRAGDKIPFSAIVYMPFMKSKLPIEIEAYIKRMNCNIFYINDSKELENVLKELKE